MTQEQAYDKLSEYVDGGLCVEERREVEVFAAQDRDFAEAIILCRTMNLALEDQTSIQPRLDFTVQVLYKAGIIDRLPLVQPVKWGERFERWAPAAAIAGVLLLGAGSLGGLASNFIGKAASLISSLTGVEAFATHPVLLIALGVPAGALVFAVLALSGRWQTLRN